MRRTFDCSKVNDPKAIAGIEWKLVVGICAFFGMAVLLYRAPGVLIFPVTLIGLLRGPAKKDGLFLKIFLRHRVQRAYYSPACLTKKNQTYPRPIGFSYLTTV